MPATVNVDFGCGDLGCLTVRPPVDATRFLFVLRVLRQLLTENVRMAPLRHVFDISQVANRGFVP